jgi:PAS domain S-box-containing protein
MGNGRADLPMVMKAQPMPVQQMPVDDALLLARIATLENQVRERDDLLEAIRNGDIDEVLVAAPTGGLALYSLHSVDHPYQRFVRQIGEGAITLSDDGTMLYGSPGLAAMLGVSEEQIVGLQLHSFLGPEDKVLCTKMLARAMANGSQTELTLRSTGGKEIPVSMSLSFLRRRGDATILCGIVTDMSEQKKQLSELTEAHASLLRLAEELKQARDVAEQASEAKTRFLRGITHELRTPLNGILGYAQLLRVDAGLTAAHLAKIDGMMNAGAHLLHLISDVLNISEIEAGHIMLQASQIRLVEFATASLDLVRPMAEAKGLSLSVAAASNLPDDIIADPTRVRQVLFNLIGNAVKFTDSGSVELRLRLVTGEAFLRMEVVDTGPGIPADMQHHLFKEFERLSPGARDSVEGAGLGLALSARIAAYMGGRLGYEDNPNGGSIFWLELPLFADPSSSGPHASEHGQTDRGSAAPLRVLIADDVAMNRDIACSFLGLAGYVVVCVEGGREAVAAAADEDFDIVLMDVRMPGMDGLEATRRIRAIEGPRGRVPIVALTAQAFSAQMQECFEAGMDEYLAKPLTLTVLLDTVERVAAVRQAAPERVIDVAMPVTAPGVTAPALMPPVINCATFAATTAVLSPEAVASYLRTLIGQSETLRNALRAPGALLVTSDALAEAAHALAGSASMFGFERLAEMGRHFEHAVLKHTGEAQALASDLAAALETALEEMRRKVHPSGGM